MSPLSLVINPSLSKTVPTSSGTRSCVSPSISPFWRGSTMVTSLTRRLLSLQNRDCYCCKLNQVKYLSILQCHLRNIAMRSKRPTTVAAALSATCSLSVTDSSVSARSSNNSAISSSLEIFSRRKRHSVFQDSVERDGDENIEYNLHAA